MLLTIVWQGGLNEEMQVNRMTQSVLSSSPPSLPSTAVMRVLRKMWSQMDQLWDRISQRMSNGQMHFDVG